jgi:hypothetical protein
MDYEQALQRLYYHANITEAEAEGWSSFGRTLFEAKPRIKVPDLREQTTDIIACLEVVNRHLNGETPSASVGTGEQYIDPRAAYAVSVIISDGIEQLLTLAGSPAADLSAVLVLGKDVWRVSCAWEAVLAGDIDSLSEHVAEEEWEGNREPKCGPADHPIS